MIKLYKKEPKSVKKSDKIELFNKELKSLLLSHSFSSVDEFLEFWIKLVHKVILSASSD